ncbi:hypothetical protein MUP59_05630 [Candidatus Bathyarchaeota archaeon]|nr:hypothetical protein [Candidatus Bathyarchaeota archaeon]
MEIKHYKMIKRIARRAHMSEGVLIPTEDALELLKLLDDYRDFNNHLLAYMTMGYSTRFKTLYDVKAEAIALHKRME